MQITEVRVFPVDEGKLRAYASIVLDGCFIVNDLKVIQGKKGLFISMPSRRRKRGGYRDVAHPLNNETRALIEETVIAAYEAAAADGTAVSRSYDEDDGADPGAAEPEEEAGTAGEEAPAPTARTPAPGPAGPKAPAEPVAAAPEGEDRSLEEVQQHHLRDSFWSVP